MSAVTADVAMAYIERNPGKAAKEIVEDLVRQGVIESGTDNHTGQIGALLKMLKQGRLPRVFRDESTRPYRFYAVESGGQNGNAPLLRAKPIEGDEKLPLAARKLLEELRSLNVASMTPIEALTKLHQFSEMARRSVGR